MARPQKKGLDYFPLDVDFFGDKKIKVLKGRYGADGITVFLYLLTLIYRDNGYYTTYDDDLTYIISDELNMSNEKIEQIINFLCERSLLDGKLFTSDKVLTSHGIQLRYQKAKAESGKKNDIEVNAEFWVLKENETQGFIKFTHSESFSGKNDSYSPKNDSYSPEKLHKEKKSKEKKIKVNKIKAEEIKENNSAYTAAVAAYEENIAPITPVVSDKIYDWLNDVDVSLIEYAIEEAVSNNKRNWKYINAIIKNHFDSGARRRSDIKARTAAKNSDKNSDEKDGFMSGEYDYSALENREWKGK